MTFETARGLPVSDFTTTFTVARPPQAVFDAIVQVRAWWEGEISGSAERVGDRFTYRSGTLHRSTQTVTELVPGRRVVWRVSDAELTFVDVTDEWNGTDVIFELTPKADLTEVRFTHRGLTPRCLCYGGCSEGWSFTSAPCCEDFSNRARNLRAADRTVSARADPPLLPNDGLVARG